MTNNTPLALPLSYKEKIIYTLAMNVRELVTLTLDRTAAPEETLPEMDYILQALQQVHFSPTSPEPLPKEERKADPLDRVASLLKDGWIAQDSSGTWYYYPEEPEIFHTAGRWDTKNNEWYSLSPFNLPHSEDWTSSLYQIKEGKIVR